MERSRHTGAWTDTETVDARQRAREVVVCTPLGIVTLDDFMVASIVGLLEMDTHKCPVHVTDRDKWTTLTLQFGIWSNCVKSGSTISCTSQGLGYQQPAFQAVVNEAFVNKLPYALVLQPISAGFTGAAAGAAFLHLCTNTVLWPLAAIWASFLTMAALVIELVLFILARNKFRDAQFATDMSVGTGTTTVTSSNLGPAIWMQVASLPPCFFGFMMLAAAWWMKRKAASWDDDFEPAKPVYSRDREEVDPRESYRRSRAAYYEDDRDQYDARDRPVSGYDRETREPRRSYAPDPYGGSRSSLVPATAPLRGSGRTRRYSERGAY